MPTFVLTITYPAAPADIPTTIQAAAQTWYQNDWAARNPPQPPSAAPAITNLAAVQRYVAHFLAKVYQEQRVMGAQTTADATVSTTKAQAQTDASQITG